MPLMVLSASSIGLVTGTAERLHVEFSQPVEVSPEKHFQLDLK